MLFNKRKDTSSFTWYSIRYLIFDVGGERGKSIGLRLGCIKIKKNRVLDDDDDEDGPWSTHVNFGFYCFWLYVSLDRTAT